MSHRKQPSKRKLAAALGSAGLSLSLAGGISAASAAPTADMPTRNTGASHEITLCEEEVSDVSWRRSMFLTPKILEHSGVA
jgi:hypothetical protein